MHDHLLYSPPLFFPLSHCCQFCSNERNKCLLLYRFVAAAGLPLQNGIQKLSAKNSMQLLDTLSLIKPKMNVAHFRKEEY